MISKVKNELDFWENLRDFCLENITKAQEQGVYDELSNNNYTTCNVVINVLKRLLK